MISVKDIIVRSEIADTPFICDLKKCKGACCTFESKYGAPLRQDEIGKIDNILDTVIHYLPQRHIDEIEENGFYIEEDGELLTNSIDNKECVFVYRDNGIAKCSIEKAFVEGKTDFKKTNFLSSFPNKNIRLWRRCS